MFLGTFYENVSAGAAVCEWAIHKDAMKYDLDRVSRHSD